MSISSEKVNCGGRVDAVVVGRGGRGLDIDDAGAGSGAVGLDFESGLEDNRSMTSGIFFCVSSLDLIVVAVIGFGDGNAWEDAVSRDIYRYRDAYIACCTENWKGVLSNKQKDRKWEKTMSR